MKNGIRSGLFRAGARALAFVSFLALSTACASAGPVLTWNLVGVTFSDGATAVGFFTYNASNPNTIVNWDIYVSGSSVAPHTYYFNSANSSMFSITPTTVDFANFSLPFSPELLLGLSSAMTNSGGVIPLNLGATTPSSLDCFNSSCGTATAGYITTAPEPAPVLLCASGLLMAGLVFFRRRRSAALVSA